MVSAKFVQPSRLIASVSQELKKSENVKPEEWARFVKSGAHRNRIPDDPDFWYVRSASILRRIYIEGDVGVQRLRTYYGARKKRGHAPPKTKRAGGSILRKILQQLEKEGYIEKAPKGGRRMTKKGMKFLDGMAKVVKGA